ncbi:MAG: hypothetical protein L0387_41155 [Acidobacteria bacterium]|nr:hypothetical protein [Acidobacteriota bacterium]MCI0722226.1 hypothetical protein [Acidobacteriota bacterium]
MDYLMWNERLATHFFQPDYEGRRIFLYVTADVLGEIAGCGDALRDYVTAIKSGPPGATRQGLCQRALQTFERWRDRRGTFPPYIGYLSLFVLAAGIEGDFAAHAYYPRLRQLLGEEPTIGQYPSFHRMWELWIDLERWANEDQGARLGVFKADIAGGWEHVGLPIAQTILTQSERECLPLIFAECGLEPGTIPADEQLAQMLVARGQHRLRPRTLHLLEPSSNQDTTLRTLLLQTVFEELEEWDGQCVFEEDKQTRISGSLRLCCKLDRVSGRVAITLCCKSSQDLPEGGLALRCEPVEGKWVCEEHGFGWSTELTNREQSANLDASFLDWTQSVTARSDDGKWVFRMAATEVRILEAGGSYGLAGLVECARLPRHGRFYLLCRDRIAGAIEAWGYEDCTAFEEIAVHSGLPMGWRMFAVSEPRSDQRVRDAFPMLSFNDSVRLRCQGGIQHAHNRYFTFALPRIFLEGGDTGITVWANGTPLPGSKHLGVFELLPELERPGKLSLEARRGDEVLARRGLYLSDEPLSTTIDSPWCDRFGRCVEAGENASGDAVACGAAVAVTPPPFEEFFLPDLHTNRRVIFLGRKPGQIATLPQEPFPTEWRPVWAVPIERRGSALFCGTGIADAQPQAHEVGDRRSIRRWKEVLWHWRCRISPPTHQLLAGLWERYQQEARKL